MEKQLDIKQKISKPKRIAIVVSDNDHLALKALAKKNKTSLSEVIRAVIRYYFGQNN